MSDVRLDRLAKHFREMVAVDDISLTVAEGEFFSLLGPSGCGKTTTLRMIGGFEEPTSGSIFIGESDVTELPAYRRDVNTVFQSYALFPHLDVFNNVAYGLKRRKVGGAEIETRVNEMLDLVDLEGFGKRKISQLSGGQQQRVALARALVNRPAVLLLDEPLGALDLKLRKQMQLELKRIQSEVGITFIYVTHDQEEAMTMSDRIAVMNAGRFEQIGAPHDVYEVPDTRFVASFLGASNLLDGEVEGVDGDVARVRLAAGATVSLPAKRLPASRKVSIGVRPEKIRLAGNGNEPANSVIATVGMSTYTGVSTAYECKTSDGAKIVVYVQNMDALSAPVKAGSSVTLSWHPDHTFAVATEEGDQG
ncbi:MAG TPA: ABC transporter ATP-binding protein [Actinomycetota bacterium]|nr:ABC transporter ATP-binding protein [Actinomycetota bacterium]